MLTNIVEYYLNKYADVCTDVTKMALKFMLCTCIGYIY